jgi:hypothetical protein
MVDSTACQMRSKSSPKDITPATADRLLGFGGRTSDYFLIIAACVAYVAAKNITSNGRVTLDEFQYWLVGIIPFILLVAVSRTYRHYMAAVGARIYFDEGFFALAWLLTLLQFVALRVTLWSESFEFPIYETFSYNYLTARIIFSGLYSLYGYATAIAVSLLLSNQRPMTVLGVWSIPIGCGLNAILFYVLVFAWPAS